VEGNMEIVGRTTIHPLAFYSGKLSGYLAWMLLGLDSLGVRAVQGLHAVVLDYLSYSLLVVAAVFFVSSLMSLGRSTRLGLPTGQTKLKTGGVYRVSRNPMYVGFDALTLAAILGTGNSVVLVLGVYSIVVYHFIIAGEESYLSSVFGTAYAEYRASVRKYL
jgi:protein-S-isoprenylcysteine O-methyltransferase Ste14